MSIDVKDYHHVALVVKNLDRCIGFYGGVLGLKTLERPDFGFPGHWFQVGQNSQLHLMVMNETIPETMRHMAIEGRTLCPSPPSDRGESAKGAVLKTANH